MQDSGGVRNIGTAENYPEPSWAGLVNLIPGQAAPNLDQTPGFYETFSHEAALQKALLGPNAAITYKAISSQLETGSKRYCICDVQADRQMRFVKKPL